MELNNALSFKNRPMAQMVGKELWERERAERLMKAGKMTAAGLFIIEEAEKSGSWNQACTSLKRDRIPADLRKALAKDKRALDNFQRFASSHRNIYIHWVKSAKTDRTRRERIEKVVKQASQNKKLISHYQLF